MTKKRTATMIAICAAIIAFLAGYALGSAGVTQEEAAEFEIEVVEEEQPDPTELLVEKDGSCSMKTNDGEYPYAVEEPEGEYDMVLEPIYKVSSKQPSTVFLNESPTTDSLPEIAMNVDGIQIDWGYEIENVETKWIDIRLEDGETVKAGVNTTLVLYATHSGYTNLDAERYPLVDGDVCLYTDHDGNLMMAIENQADNETYIPYNPW